MNYLKIYTEKERFPVAENLYGLFFEDINRAADGGLYPEMLRNRSFEDGIPPAGCELDEEKQVFTNRGGWPDAFFGGEGMPEWKSRVPMTDVPAWYMQRGTMTLLREDTLHPNREAALRVEFEAGGVLKNIGYGAKNNFRIRPGETYLFTMFAKSSSKIGVCLECGFFDGDDRLIAGSYLQRSQDQRQETLVRGYHQYEAKITVPEACDASFFGIFSCVNQTVTLGFTSLMPADTYLGHGLRKDLCEMLKNTSPRFLRFPGGCIVEGFTKETAMRFPNTIGPVWTRPSHQLMWHYRTTNGLGFHEYLQLCEDLNLDALYVCNCGMSCQARVAEYFDEETTGEILQETLDALEYAMGDVSTKYGAMRAEAGHPAPFSIKYLEIGNENFGKEYEKRYEKFYQRIKEAYPELICIANAHTEESGLPTEMVDEHYYNSPEWFAQHSDMFEEYDRKGPEIFLGEYAVNGGETISSMECAIAEAMFLVGVEKNQDIVKLSAYAPLFQNVDYTAWRPNLIVFNQKQVYGIPTYHMLSMFGQNRGEKVVETEQELDRLYPTNHGIPGIMAQKEGVCFKNARINGTPVSVSQVVQGQMETGSSRNTADGEPMEEYCLSAKHQGRRITHESMLWAKKFEEFHENRRKRWALDHPEHKDKPMPDFDAMPYVVFGEEESLCREFPAGSLHRNGRDCFTTYRFEVEMKFPEDNPVTLSVWNYHPETDAGVAEPKNFGWSIPSVRRQIWEIRDGKSFTRRIRPGMKPEDVPEGKEIILNGNQFRPEEYHTYRIDANPEGYVCYIDGEKIDEVKLKTYPGINAGVTTEGDDIIIKICSIKEEDVDVEIETDCRLEPEGSAQILCAPLDAVNSFEQPENVSPGTITLSGLSEAFTYRVKGHSVNVIRCRKQH